jgi:hypothetical protein
LGNDEYPISNKDFAGDKGVSGMKLEPQDLDFALSFVFGSSMVGIGY